MLCWPWSFNTNLELAAKRLYDSCVLPALATGTPILRHFLLLSEAIGDFSE